MNKSIKKLFGEIICWIVSFAYNLSAIKAILGGLFMAVHRVLCLKFPKITFNPQIQRQISKQLMVLEWLTIMFLGGFNSIQAFLTDTNSVMAFCRGHSLEMDLIIKQG